MTQTISYTLLFLIIIIQLVQTTSLYECGFFFSEAQFFATNWLSFRLQSQRLLIVTVPSHRLEFQSLASFFYYQLSFSFASHPATDKYFNFINNFKYIII